MKKKLAICGFAASVLLSCTKAPVETSEAISGSDKNTATTSAIYTAGLGTQETILLNACGYNPRNYMLEEPYSQPHDPDLQLGLVSAKANCIRYPGGTFANYWDYNNDRMFQKASTHDAGGWVTLDKVSTDLNDSFRKRIDAGLGASDGILKNSVNDLKYAAKGGTSGQELNVVFHMNMVTPGKEFYESAQGWNRAVNGTVGSADWYKMLDDRYDRFKGMLMRAKSGTDAIPIRFIELGNEYYFDITYVVEAFPNGAAHGTAANYIANKLKTDTDLNLSSNIRIAATANCVTGGDTRRQNWNNSLASTLDRSKVGFVTMHSYEAYSEPGTYTESSFQNALVNWYQSVNSKFVNSGADDNFIKAANPWRIWYTETNANWNGGFDGDPSGEKEWGQSLIEAYSVVHHYDRGNATIYLQFQFNNQVKPDAEIVGGRRLYNRALALKPFMEATKDATSGTRIDFGGTGMPKLPDNTKAVVQGYVFKTSAGVPHAVLINLSGTDKHVNLAANIFTSAGTLNKVGYKNSLGSIDPAIIINTTDTRGDVTLPPYSVIHFYQ
ncbi:MAG: hypothetical protein K0S09_1715 [Sphingobacteriaceae bacterium]|jgi:hypothetical protein|nr:hypothetical protein [Sphingobacteriaceae bacterium]